ncbi:hypothetical protein BJ742DRAFT_882694 [Cladochytrium replicatum]|nr:hypothetical protein BJ742DRAFT_882694 [Cladochytrium replicatum]
MLVARLRSLYSEQREASNVAKTKIRHVPQSDFTTNIEDAVDRRQEGTDGLEVEVNARTLKNEWGKDKRNENDYREMLKWGKSGWVFRAAKCVNTLSKGEEPAMALVFFGALWCQYTALLNPAWLKFHGEFDKLKLSDEYDIEMLLLLHRNQRSLRNFKWTRRRIELRLLKELRWTSRARDSFS